eukprot:Skav202565  [mRNA]  locus=scaffold2177:224914:234104:- [translate_table: standard]
MITIGVIDTDENVPWRRARAARVVPWEGQDVRELQSRYFPEPHIPNVTLALQPGGWADVEVVPGYPKTKFFLQGKKRQPVTVQNATGMSLDELAESHGERWRWTWLIEQHTGISIQQAIEKGFPAYAERVGASHGRRAGKKASRAIFGDGLGLPMEVVEEKLVAATRIFRFLLRWSTARRRLSGLPPLSVPWAPPAPPSEMSAAAQRHSWRLGELGDLEEHRHGLAELGLLLDRGMPPDTAPFGLTPLCRGERNGEVEVVDDPGECW